jgi:hypothetical protein
VIKHAGNIRRLLNGTERRLGAPKPAPGTPATGTAAATTEKEQR